MTTNKPEVVAWRVLDMRHPQNLPEVYRHLPVWAEGDEALGIEPLIRLSDYEALEAECEGLELALAETRANDRQAMSYLTAVRGMVGGDDFPEMVERVGELQAECEKLRAAMIEAKSYMDHYMYGGSIYREPASEAIALIDDALQEAADDN